MCHQCASNGHLPLLQLLVRRGANISIKNRDGHTPLDIAVIRGHTPLVRYLEVQSGSLACMCRVVIRESMQKRCPFRLGELPLPATLKLFINYNIPYPGWMTVLIVPRPWSAEEVASGKVTRTEVQSFIEDHASEEFLEEKRVKGRKVENKELSELIEALYFWESFKTIDYDEPLAPSPRYSMEHTMKQLHLLEKLKIH